MENSNFVSKHEYFSNYWRKTFLLAFKFVYALRATQYLHSRKVPNIYKDIYPNRQNIEADLKIVICLFLVILRYLKKNCIH